MDISDVCEATALKAHVVIHDAGRPTWNTFPDAWSSSWMAEAIREGRVATMRQASDEAAWYDGGRTMRPQRPAPAAEVREATRGQHRKPVWEGVAARGVGGHQRPRRVRTAGGRPR
jgi:hypothetical protein